MSYDTISVDDIYHFYKDFYTDIKIETVRWYIYTLKKDKVLKHLSRGQYVIEDNTKDKTDYVVVTMDIINSSQMSYKDFGNDLHDKINKINSIIKDSSTDRQFHISQGDAIQIVFPFTNKLSIMIMTALSYLRPYKARYGIGIGSLDDTLEDNSWDMNGPLFWNARDSLNEIKSVNDYSGMIKSDNNFADKISNSILLLINNNISKITDKQWEALRYELSDTTVEQALNELGISRSSYYERVKMSNINDIAIGFHTVFEIMNKRNLFD
jgi:hypothetical protein